MKTFRSEFLNNYSTYTFAYAGYAVMESHEDIPLIYSGGYLPYTGNINLNYPVFYQARSLRVNIDFFEDSSENRRVERKMSLLNPLITKIAISSELAEDQDFLNFCLKYAEQRFSYNAMNTDRLKYILNIGIATDLFVFKNSDDHSVFAYVLAVLHHDTYHFWFSFFNTEYMNELPIGKWLMWRMIKWAKENNFNHVYLGTAYGDKSLYKIRDFKGLEFFDGNMWSKDMKLLKQLCKNDDQQMNSDLFKTAGNCNDYIKMLLKEDKLT
jgi:arginine-tRNA-protein transferase